jgi:hypothetical protein
MRLKGLLIMTEDALAIRISDYLPVKWIFLHFCKSVLYSFKK